MENSSLSREKLKAHNATEKHHEGGSKHDTFSMKTPMSRDRAGTMQSESSTGTGTHSKLKLQRLRHKIKLVTGSFSKSGSESQITKHFENTYRTEPKNGTRFKTKAAEDIISQVLDGNLKGKPYDSKKFPNLAKSLAELIKERVKNSGCERYKIVAHVTILENKGQSLRQVSRSLWNKETDNYATVSFEGNGFTAIGSVFATYYD
ncbi:dynein light chain Tctex-type protein 2B-like [Dreissena polymorpha]|uniref:Uncharacterized protein n=1 Tax=Dreissena polymorpha TaxID=45954 RepID=A0A9D4KTY7_DREPO|nr:dynein light chain Tctex-type protein 2B-like [Dreissena polymorpha]KAH3846065.1 hypothetical protein DPMN_088359 [Dreissena polymorpha]